MIFKKNYFNLGFATFSIIYSIAFLVTSILLIKKGELNLGIMAILNSTLHCFIFALFLDDYILRIKNEKV